MNRNGRKTMRGKCAEMDPENPGNRIPRSGARSLGKAQVSMTIREIMARVHSLDTFSLWILGGGTIDSFCLGYALKIIFLYEFV